jgi:hypothetical protein
MVAVAAAQLPGQRQLWHWLEGVLGCSWLDAIRTRMLGIKKVVLEIVKSNNDTVLK